MPVTSKTQSKRRTEEMDAAKRKAVAGYKSGGMVFKACASCKSPAKCKAAGKCLAKAKK
jgi:hypothetical protein